MSIALILVLCSCGQKNTFVEGNLLYDLGAESFEDIQKVGFWYEAYQGRVSLTENITQSDINTINTLISNNDEWSYLDNCSSFATGIWNEISSVNLNAGFPKTPASLVESIKSKSGYETNRTIQYNTNIGYVQNGNFVSVVLANNRRNVNVVQFVEPINLNPNSFEI